MTSRAIVVLLSAFAVACGPTGAADEPTSAAAPSTTLERPDTTEWPDTTTTITAAPPEAPRIEISNDTAEGPDVVRVALGETVEVVLADVDDEIHVHGYDLFFELRAGVPYQLTFTADVPGIFEVETHDTRVHLFDVEVSG
ncbi:MAG TPA: hypothetical protein VMM14_09115 [Acidimicrobiia bacterium]|nr:hypothetical protein [Acidimicrobiia bacterium]